MRAAGNRRHLKFGKNKRVLQGDDKSQQVTGTFAKHVKKLLPYGGR
jgi:ribosomal protein L35